MSIVGFNFTKVVAERKKKTMDKYSIANNINITNVKESKMRVGKEDIKTAIFSFAFESNIDPGVGHVKIEGSMVYMNDAKMIDSIMKGWKAGKQKKLPDNIVALVMNTALTKSTILALMLSKEVNLPPLVQLPKVQIKK